MRAKLRKMGEVGRSTRQPDHRVKTVSVMCRNGLWVSKRNVYLSREAVLPGRGGWPFV